MAKSLVIVESPAKSKTIEKYLGKDFKVLASYGHVRDLVSKEGSVDTENNFQMKYKNIERNKKHIDAIKQATKEAEIVYLAADPDREGEAISWNILQILEKAKPKLTTGKKIHRVAFNEITKNAVLDAINNPRELSMDLVNAQQARLALDYLVGFTLSPVLWKKIRYGLSAGRVQSPALRLIVEREKDIQSFVKQEYWSLNAELNCNKKNLSAKLFYYNEKKLNQFDISSEKSATTAKNIVLKDANGFLIVTDVTKKQKRRNPPAPFITSTLQQEAAKKYGFSAKKTMLIAQQLYEGIKLENESVGLITYMRTDSVNLSKDALVEIRKFINSEYNESFLPKTPRVFKTKAKNAQEAHEAIRPSSIIRRPISLAPFLNKDQLKLYTIIWKRTIASQMVHATLDTVTAEMSTKNKAHRFKTSGSVIKKKGFLELYQETNDEDQKENDSGREQTLPNFEINEEIILSDIKTLQHFTEPKPRYTEASLVKSLEEHGIGRPSTYATIISTLQTREYVILESKRFHPTDVGTVVNKFLTEFFKQYVEYSYTSQLEDQLDSISQGNKEWLHVLKDFWVPFNEIITQVAEKVQKSDITSEEIDEDCPECGSRLNIKLGKRGKFIACTNYPTCKYTRPLAQNKDEEKTNEEPEIIQDRKCPKCNSDLHIKSGRYGKFIGCSNYPECKHMEPLSKPKDTGVTCPKCNENNIMEKKSRKGKTFYACNGWPKCKYAIWYKPIEEKCPKCNWPILMHKVTKKFGEQKVCPQEECDYVENIEASK